MENKNTNRDAIESYLTAAETALTEAKKLMLETGYHEAALQHKVIAALALIDSVSAKLWERGER